MTEIDNLPPHLKRLGQQLISAADELNDTRRQPRVRWRRPTRRLAIGIAAAAIAIPGVAIAATQIITTGQVATGLADANQALIATDPTCTVVRANVEYRCTLADAPSDGGPVQFSVTTQPDGGVKVLIVENPENGDIESATVNGTALPDYNHMLAQAKALASASRPGAGTVTTSTTDSITTPTTDWTGTTELTVGSSKHVNGACRALDMTGTQWNCYIGQAAVSQGLLTENLLGQYAPKPTVG